MAMVNNQRVNDGRLIGDFVWPRIPNIGDDQNFLESYLISTKGRQNPWNPPVKIGIAGTYNFICPSYDHQISPNYIVNEDNQYWEKLGCVSQVAGSQLSENGAYPQYVANGFRVHWVHSIPVGQVWTRTTVPRSTDCEISATTDQNPRSTKRIMSLCKKIQHVI